MAGQAGWYRAPGEEGLLRYWNGSAWTDHRQPAPVAEQAAPEPDWSMDQFEKQFAVASDSVLSFDPHLASEAGPHDDHTASPAPAPAPALAAPIAAPSFIEPFNPTTAPPSNLAGAALAPAAGFVTALQTAPIAPPAPGPSIATGTQASASEHFVSESRTAVPTSDAPDSDVAAAALADGAREDRARRRVIGAVRGMVVGILLVLIGVGVMLFLDAQNSVGVGDIKTVGIVTSLGSKGGSCTPVARYAGRGGSFSATTATALTPCPVSLGQSVDVVFKISNPSGSGQIVMPNPIQQYIWAAPVIGVLVFLVSVIAFIVRAGTIVAGVALIRGGRKPRRRSLQDA